MTAAPEATVRTLAFGDLEPGVWGVVWTGASASPTFVALGAGHGFSTPAGHLDADSDEWELRGQGVQLAVAPAGPAVEVDGGGFDQLCRAAGRIVVDGDEHRVSCLGARAVHRRLGDPDRFESVRAVSAWFEPAEGLALLAQRPRGAPGQERDLIAASVLDQEEPRPVAEARLSMAYGRDGVPARVGFELWADEQEYPRRAAGEATGRRVATEIDGVRFDAQLLRFHSRGKEGTGVYLLARRG